METWLETANVDSDEKKVILNSLFAKSNLALIYGAAGTGKTTLIKHISNYFANAKKLFLANTNPAKDNLQRQIHVGNSDFSTIASSKKYIEKYEYDVVIIDECSTVDNRTMDNLLQSISYKLLILVGDVYQIQSVQFGNWFSLARYFMPSDVLYELTTPYRTENPDLINLWNKVRSLDDKIAECLYHHGYSSGFDETLFSREEEDEIMLCLNYDGLYGINNLNRFLQNDNTNPPFHWENRIYKVGDPIIFSEHNRFYPTIYNNLKGWIRKIEREPDKITFNIEIPIALNELDILSPDLTLLDCAAKGHSLIRFSVNHFVDDDEKEKNETEIVPFQVAYAISIHKAQGLEYNSVKIVISNQVDELISHNVFYTAITRARKLLKIYWTPETQQTVLDGIKPISNKRDACVISGKFGLKLLNQVD
ncbi:MAG: AAA family ATPase [Clostridiales bacterium]|nr:AAA family ATPase [Clostridiales bacterium]